MRSDVTTETIICVICLPDDSQQENEALKFIPDVLSKRIKMQGMQLKSS